MWAGVKLLEKNDFRNQRPALPEGRSAAPAAKAAAKAVVGRVGSTHRFLSDGSNGGFGGRARLALKAHFGLLRTFGSNYAE